MKKYNKPLLMVENVTMIESIANNPSSVDSRFEIGSGSGNNGPEFDYSDWSDWN